AEVVTKLLAKSPDQRFQTPAELAQHLNEILASGVCRTKSSTVPSVNAIDPTQMTIDTGAFWAAAVGDTEIEQGRQRRPRSRRLAIAAIVLLLGGLLAGLLFGLPRVGNTEDSPG